MKKKNIKNIKKVKLLKKTNVQMPRIPQILSDNYLIREVLYSTVNEFHFDEQSIIYLYCFIGMSTSEIVSLEEVDPIYVDIVLSHFSKKLKHKVDLFERALSYHKIDDVEDSISTKDLFEIEIEDVIMGM